MSERLDLFLTTEAFALSAQRGTINAETMGRTSAFLTTLSAGFVLLGLLGPAVKFDVRFLGAAAGVCAALTAFGGITFSRLTQLSIDDSRCTRGLERIRCYYREQIPEAGRWITSEPQSQFSIASGATALGRGQLLLTAAGLISVLTALLAATSVGCLVAALRVPFVGCLAFGLLVATGLFIHCSRHQVEAFREIEQTPDPSQSGA